MDLACICNHKSEQNAKTINFIYSVRNPKIKKKLKEQLEQSNDLL